MGAFRCYLIETLLGCHDNGYVTTLRSHITSGSGDKLILLQSYDEVASGIVALNLPIISIPNLFLSQKLAPIATPQVLQKDLPMSPRTSSILPPLEIKGSRSRSSSLAKSDSSLADSTSGALANPSPGHPLHSLPVTVREINRAIVSDRHSIADVASGYLTVT